MFKKNTQLLACAALLHAQASHAETYYVTPSNYATEMAKVRSGDTVRLTAGTYWLSSSKLSQMTKYSNVKFVGDSSSSTRVDPPGNNQSEIRFDSKGAIKLQKINFTNAHVYMRNCSNHVVSNCEMETWASASHPSLFTAYLGGGGKLKNTKGKWNYSSIPQKLYKVQDQNGYTIYNADGPTSKTKGGIETGATRGTIDIDLCDFERSSSTSGSHEDHGIYVHSANVGSSGAVYVDGGVIKGWSQNASGYALKIKESRWVRAIGITTYTSGIMLRDGTLNRRSEDNMVKSCVLNDGNISSYHAQQAARSIRIEGNTVKKETINVNSGQINPSYFNESLTVINSWGGGVMNNKTKNALDLRSGVANWSNSRL